MLNFQFDLLSFQDDLDDNEYAEASNTLLDAWITTLSHSDDFPPDLFKKHSTMIVETYIKCHIVAPEGIKPNDFVCFLFFFNEFECC